MVILAVDVLRNKHAGSVIWRKMAVLSGGTLGT